MNDTSPGHHSAPRKGTPLRIAGIVILLLGLIAAGLASRTGNPGVDLSDDVSTARTSKKLAHDIEVNVGKMGVFMDDLMDDWQDPATRAATIIIASILVASGCFYFAHLQARGDNSPSSTS